MSRKSARETILDTLDEVFSYAVDTTATVELKHAGNKSVILDQETFRDTLYAKTIYQPLIEELERRLDPSSRATLLTGSAGWGKSSALDGASHRFMKKPYSYILSINLKQAYSYVDNQGLDSALSSYIKKRQMQDAWQHLENLGMSDTEYIAQLLAGVTQNDINSASNRMRLKYSNLEETLNAFKSVQYHLPCPENLSELNTREERVYAWNQFLSSLPKALNTVTQNASVTLAEYKAAIKEFEDLEHIIAVLLVQHEDARLALIYDNIDFIPSRIRPSAFNYAQGLLISFSGTVSTIIAIREETLKTIRLERDDALGAFFEAIRPGDYTIDIGDAVSLLPRQIQRLARPGMNLRSYHVLEYLALRCNYVWDCIGKLCDDSDAELREQLTEVQDSAIEIARHLLESGVGDLANDNMRTVAYLFVEFLRELYRVESLNLRMPGGWDPIDDTQVSTIIRKHGSMIQTRFYTWLRSSTSIHGIHLESVVKTDTDWKRTDDIGEIFHIDHLLLSCIRNATKEHMVSLETVISRMEMIGFHRPAILKTFRDNYIGINATINTIGTLENEDSFVDIQVGLMPLGHVLLDLVFPSMGYLLGKVLEGKTYTEKMRNYYGKYLHSSKRRTAITSRLAQVAHIHLKGLWAIGNVGTYKGMGNNWLHRYLEWFSVDGNTQIERQLVSARDFLSHGSDKSIFTNMLDEYLSCRDLIASGSTFSELDTSFFERLYT